MVSVSADDVRDVINITSEEVPDDKVLKMIKRAEVTLELETNKTVDYSNCNEAEKITGTRQAFLKKEEYEALVNAADIMKLAKMLRILGFLTQTKVYLFWKKQQSQIEPS